MKSVDNSIDATKDRIVLVLGAGASHDYGFPLGRKLRDDICRVCLSPTPSLCDITGFASTQFKDFGKRLSEYSLILL